MNVFLFKTLGIQFEQYYLGGRPKKKTFIHQDQSDCFLLPIGTHLLTGCMAEEGNFLWNTKCRFLAILRERRGLSARPLPLSNQQQKS